MKSEHVVFVRPKRSLLRYGFITFLATTVPLFSVLYWHTGAAGTWGQIAAIHAGIALLCLVAYWRQNRVFTTVADDALTGNGIFSRAITVPLAAISQVVLVEVYRSYSMETVTQLVALDHSGRCRFRMRGNYWHKADIRALADAAGGEAVIHPAPLGEREFFARFPGSRFWFENNPLLRYTLIVLTVAVVAVVASWLMTVLGFR